MFCVSYFCLNFKITPLALILFFFFFNDTATTEIYTLSLHDALPISGTAACWWKPSCARRPRCPRRSEEHTSELQSQFHLVCRLLLEKKKKHVSPPRDPQEKNNAQRHERYERPA